MDYVVNRAESLGITIAFLPVWGDKVSQKWGKGPVVMTPENARIYGEWLGKGMNHLQATRLSEGSFALVYRPLGNPLSLNLSALTGAVYRAAWFNPKTGVSEVFGQVHPAAAQEFTPPSVGKDSILTLYVAT